MHECNKSKYSFILFSVIQILQFLLRHLTIGFFFKVTLHSFTCFYHITSVQFCSFHGISLMLLVKVALNYVAKMNKECSYIQVKQFIVLKTDAQVT